MRAAAHVALTIVFLGIVAAVLWLASAPPRGNSLDPAPAPGPIPAPQDMTRLDPMLRQMIEQRRAKITENAAEAKRWATLGWAYHASGMLELALACYDQAAKLEPAEGRWPYYRGLVRVEIGESEHEQAIADFKRATELRENYAAAYWRLGMLELQAEKIDDAEQTLSVASRLDPESPVPLLGLSMVAIARKQDEEAKVWLQNVLAQHHDLSYARHLLAQVCDRLGKQSEGDWYRRLGTSEVEPTWHDDWEYKVFESKTGYAHTLEGAQRNLDAGRFPAAITKLEKARPFWPNDAAILAMLARAHYELGRYDTAIETAQQALQQSTSVPGQATHLLITLGRAQGRLGKWPEAAATFQRATASDSASGDAWLYLADAQLKLQARDQAAAALAEAEKHNPTDQATLKSVRETLQPPRKE